MLLLNDGLTVIYPTEIEKNIKFEFITLIKWVSSYGKPILNENGPFSQSPAS